MPAESASRADPFRSFLGLGVILLLGLLALAGVKSYRDLAAARNRQAALEAEIEATGERVDELTERIGRLRSDPATLERLAREELGMVKPADVVIVLPEEELPR